MNIGMQATRGMPAVVQPVSQAHTASPVSHTTSFSSPPPLQDTSPTFSVTQVQGATHVKNAASSPVMAQAPTAAYYIQPVQLPVSDIVRKI